MTRIFKLFLTWIQIKLIIQTLNVGRMTSRLFWNFNRLKLKLRLTSALHRGSIRVHRSGPTQHVKRWYPNIRKYPKITILRLKKLRRYKKIEGGYQMFNLERYQFLKAVECDLEHTQTHICITVHNLYPQKLSS